MHPIPGLTDPPSGHRNDNLLQSADVRLQLLSSRRNPIELKNIGHDVDIGLVIQAARISERHRAANLLESIRDGLALPTEFKRSLGEVWRLGVGAVKILPMTSCALGLKGTLSIL